MNQLAKRTEDTDNQLAGAALGTGATMQRIQTPYVTAVSVQKPREFKELIKRAEQEAEIMGEDFFYSWEVHEKDRDTGEVKKREIAGISHDGALALMRHWGNCAYDPQLQNETDQKWTFAVSFVDYEAGITTPRLMQVTKEKAPGKYGQERWLDMCFQNGQSRAIRNAILAGLPNWLKKRCLKAARTAEESRFKSKPADQLAQERDKLVAFAKKLGLNGNHLRSEMGKGINEYTAKDIVKMRAILRSIQDNEATVEQIFGSNDLNNQTDKQARGERDRTNGQRNGGGDRQSKATEPSTFTMLGQTMAKAQALDDLEATGTKVGEAHRKGEITDEERDELAEIYRTHRAKFGEQPPNGA